MIKYNNNIYIYIIYIYIYIYAHMCILKATKPETLSGFRGARLAENSLK